MVEMIGFEYCKSNGDSRYISLVLGHDGHYYLRTGCGVGGIYLSDGFRDYMVRPEEIKKLSVAFEELGIYKWKKAYPDDYVPQKRLMGSDTGSWFLAYSECEKKRIRHIHEKIGENSPLYELLPLMEALFPDGSLMEWIVDER